VLSSLIAFSDKVALLRIPEGETVIGDKKYVLLGVAVVSSVPACGTGVGFTWLNVELVINTGIIVVGLAVGEELLTVGCLPGAAENAKGDENNGIKLADTRGAVADVGLGVVGELTTGARMIFG
jgi:hypothetical protein